MTSKLCSFVAVTLLMTSGFFLRVHAEIKRIQAVIPNLECSYGAQGITRRIITNSWFKNLTNANNAKGIIEVTLTHNNTINLSLLEETLQEAARQARYQYNGLQKLTAWGVIRHNKNGYFLHVTGSQDIIYLLEENHKKSSFFQWALNTVKEFFTGSHEKMRRKVEHLFAESCPVKLCATIHRHDDQTYGATKIVRLDAQEP